MKPECSESVTAAPSTGYRATDSDRLFFGPGSPAFKFLILSSESLAADRRAGAGSESESESVVTVGLGASESESLRRRSRLRPGPFLPTVLARHPSLYF